MAIQTFTSGQVLTAAQVNALQSNDFNQTVTTKTANATLVAADKGTRVVMNVSTASTITVNTSLFSAGDTVILQNIASNASTVTAGTATVSSAGSLAIPQFGSGTLFFTSASASIFFPSAGPASSSGLTFISSTTASGTSFTISNAFTTSFDNYLIVMANVVTGSAPGKFRLRLGAGVDHKFNLNSVGTTGTYAEDSSAASGNVFHLDPGFTTKFGTLNLISPFLSTITSIHGLTQTNVQYSILQGIENSATSFGDCTFSNANAVSFSSGTIKIYGYANS